VPCGPTVTPGIRVDASYDGVTWHPVATLPGRCLVPVTEYQWPTVSSIAFDPIYGKLIVSDVISWSYYHGPGAVVNQDAETSMWITGFPTIYEIGQTYLPSEQVIGYRVPHMPEQFVAADWFDTYWGDLATVGDWSQAQPLQCGYPATSPSFGDYFAVEDTLPMPTPGNGYYYVTAVNYQGQRRYGRRSNGGVLTGRDPAGLPRCE